MVASKRTWKEKLHDTKDLPKVEIIKKYQEKKWGKGTIAIPSPLEVDEIMRSVPRGKLITINQIRERIARMHHATIGCPITTGIFAWIAAYASEEESETGNKNNTPWWRTLKGDGFLNEKYPGGKKRHRKLLEQEGHIIRKRGEKYFVADMTEAAVQY